VISRLVGRSTASWWVVGGPTYDYTKDDYVWTLVQYIYEFTVEDYTYVVVVPEVLEEKRDDLVLTLGR